MKSSLSGMQHCVVYWKKVNISDKYTISICRTEEYAKQEIGCFHASLMFGIFFNPEHRGNMFPWNVSWLSTDYMVLYYRSKNSYLPWHCSFFFYEYTLTECILLARFLTAMEKRDKACATSVTSLRCYGFHNVMYTLKVLNFNSNVCWSVIRIQYEWMPLISQCMECQKVACNVCSE
jgi:hypothetical protein